MSQQARGPRVHERWAHLRFRAATLSQRLAALAAEGRLIKTNGGYRLAG